MEAVKEADKEVMVEDQDLEAFPMGNYPTSNYISIVCTHLSVGKRDLH